MKLLSVFDYVLGKLPLNGWKAIVGYALVQAAPLVKPAQPEVGAIMECVGSVLLPLGLAHKVTKEAVWNR